MDYNLIKRLSLIEGNKNYVFSYRFEEIEGVKGSCCFRITQMETNQFLEFEIDERYQLLKKIVCKRELSLFDISETIFMMSDVELFLRGGDFIFSYQTQSLSKKLYVSKITDIKHDEFGFYDFLRDHLDIEYIRNENFAVLTDHLNFVKYRRIRTKIVNENLKEFWKNKFDPIIKNYLKNGNLSLGFKVNDKSYEDNVIKLFPSLSPVENKTIRNKLSITSILEERYA